MCTRIYARECMHTRKRSFMRRLWRFAFPQQEAPRLSSGAEERAAHGAEERQQGSRSSVTMTPHAGQCRVRAPEGTSWFCWGWRGQKTSRRPWSNPRIAQLQGLRQSWPYRSCVSQQEGPYSLPLPAGTFIHCVCLFILLERWPCLSPAGAAAHEEHNPLATTP